MTIDDEKLKKVDWNLLQEHEYNPTTISLCDKLEE